MVELKLTERERAILCDALASRGRGLMVEARRTDSFRMRDALRAEIRTLDRIIERLDNAEGVALPAEPDVAAGADAVHAH